MTPPAASGPTSKPAYRNRILAALQKQEIAALESHLVAVDFAQGDTLLNPGQSAEFAYFMEAGLTSLIVVMETGMSVEVGVVGREGFVGLPIVLGTSSMPTRTFIQIPGSGFRLKAGILRAELERSETLRQKTNRYIQAHLMQASQTAACNRLHDIAERLARWLLMCQDRVQSDELQITHQSLADMLGTPRSTVTLAARMLQKAGLIEYSRGHIRILNRKGLEEAACECYRSIRSECDRLGVL